MNIRKNKGITLIALVITIIILIILAGIAISAVFGENGLILRAREAAFKTEAGSIKEQVEMAKIRIGSNGEFSISINTQDLETLIPDNQKTKYYYTAGNKLGIGNEKLGYYDIPESEGGFSDSEKQWLQDIGIYPILPVADIEWLEIGAYVDYTPATVSAPLTIANTRTGHNGGAGNQEFYQDTNAMSTPGNAKWRVIDKNETTVTLISAATLNGSDNEESSQLYGTGGLWLQGGLGYNNAVDIIEEICTTLYSNPGKGITARSATGEDIDKLSGVSEWTSSEWEEYLISQEAEMQDSTSGDYRSYGNHPFGVFAPDTYIAGTDISGNSPQGIGTGSSVNGTTYVRSNRNIRRYISI